MKRAFKTKYFPNPVVLRRLPAAAETNCFIIYIKTLKPRPSKSVQGGREREPGFNFSAGRKIQASCRRIFLYFSIIIAELL